MAIPELRLAEPEVVGHLDAERPEEERRQRRGGERRDRRDHGSERPTLEEAPRQRRSRRARHLARPDRHLDRAVSSIGCTELHLVDLVRGALGQLRDDLHVAGRGEVGQAAGAVGRQLMGVDGLASSGGNDELDVLFAQLRGDPDGGALGHRRVLEDHRFDLGRGDHLAAPADGVLAPVHPVEVPLVIEAGEVTGVEPEVAERGERRRRVVVVAAHHGVGSPRPDHELADPTRLDRPVVVVDDRHLELRHRPARRHVAARVVRGRCREVSGLGHREAGDEAQAEAVLELLAARHGDAGGAVHHPDLVVAVAR